MIAAHLATWLLASLTVLGAWFFFRRWSLTRPPLGTVNLGDVGFTLVCILALPFLYLWLPGWVAASLLAITVFPILWFLLEPMTSVSLVRWGVAGGLVATDVVMAERFGTSSNQFLVLNDAVIVLVAIGVSVLWVQGGLRARDMAILAGAITLYDLVATGFLPLTGDMIERLAGLPFLPMVAWPVGTGEWVGIGLGDLLMAAMGPLVLRKAYGKAHGLAAIATSLASIGLVLGVAHWDTLPGPFPTMIVLGPLLVAHTIVAGRKSGPERTTAQYLTAEPVPNRARVLDSVTFGSAGTSVARSARAQG